MLGGGSHRSVDTGSICGNISRDDDEDVDDTDKTVTLEFDIHQIEG